jgi:hypothetical protein
MHTNDFGKLYHKNAIKHKNRGPPPTFSNNPLSTPSKEFKNDCAFMNLRPQKIHEFFKELVLEHCQESVMRYGHAKF